MMIEKRFILAEDSNGLYSIFDTEDKEDEPLIYGARFGTTKIVDLLNEFNDENKELKQENKKLIEEWEFSFRTEMAHHRFAEKELQEKIREKQATIQSLKEENEKLIQNKCIPCELVSLQVREIDKLEEENEQLKKRLEHYNEVEAMNGDGKNE